MNCEEFEPLIYLYEELSEQDRLKLENHLAQCGRCRKAMEEATQQASWLKLAARITPEPVDQHQLTARVMTKIYGTKAARSVSLPEWVRWLRYSFAAASIALVLFFYAEWTRYSYSGNSSTAPQSSEASLASPSLETIRNSRMESAFSPYKLLKQKNTKE